MPNHRRISITLKRDRALHATRVSIGKSKLVYILVTDRRLKYPLGKSRIAYIGTTKRGIRRVASSAARHADEILSLRGVRSFDARVVTCQPRQRVKTWFVLERALLVAFREKYGSQPNATLTARSSSDATSSSTSAKNASRPFWKRYRNADRLTNAEAGKGAIVLFAAAPQTLI
jgi:hypothetical protein